MWLTSLVGQNAKVRTRVVDARYSFDSRHTESFYLNLRPRCSYSPDAPLKML